MTRSPTQDVQTKRFDVVVEQLTSADDLKRVVALHRGNTKTLGFFPLGAFEDHARRRQILIALTPEREFAGYLLYRTSRERATIAHLCVSESHRRKGVSFALVEALKNRTKHLIGIGLHCRRDYDAHKSWPKHGFVAVNSKPGRGRDQAELTFWWFDHKHPDLFTLAEANRTETLLRVAMDANVFYDLHERDTPESEDSKALLAPWVQECIELCLTEEIFNDINKAHAEDVRKRSRSFTTRYHLLRPDHARVKDVEAQLAEMLPASVCLRDEADVRHLAHTIAAGERYFVTRDADLASRAEGLYDRYGVTVLHPAALINELDSLAREEEYRPARLAGSAHRAALLRADMVSTVAAELRLHDEKQRDLEKRLRHFLARPKEVACRLFSDSRNTPLVLCTTDQSCSSHWKITDLRLSRDPMAPTMVRHVLLSILETASRQSVRTVTVSEPRLAPMLPSALEELGFGHHQGTWIKFIGGDICSVADLREVVASHASAVEPAAAGNRVLPALDRYATMPCAELASELEHLFWPAKLRDASLPTYIVPIQPRWARHFFDDDLGSQMLFELRTELHLGIEGAYYRSKRGPKLSAPGRVLWYVSQGTDKDGAMSVKACSRLAEVVVGPAKDLFKRFRRLGVYDRDTVMKLGQRDQDGAIMALRFTMTERFSSPVPLSWLNEVGVYGNLPGPREVPSDIFEKIYAKGMAGK